MEECPKCKDRGTVFRDGRTEWCDCTVALVLRGSLRTVKQANRGGSRKRKPTEESIPIPRELPREPVEKSIPTFFGLALKGWKHYKEGFVLDFGDRGLLFRGVRMPEIGDRMVGQVLTDWEWLPDVEMILYFGETGLQFKAPVEIVEMQRKGLFQ